MPPLKCYLNTDIHMGEQHIHILTFHTQVSMTQCTAWPTRTPVPLPTLPCCPCTHHCERMPQENSLPTASRFIVVKQGSELTPPQFTLMQRNLAFHTSYRSSLPQICCIHLVFILKKPDCLLWHCGKKLICLQNNIHISVVSQVGDEYPCVLS